MYALVVAADSFLILMHQVANPLYAISGKGQLNGFFRLLSNFLNAFHAELYLSQVFFDKEANRHFLASSASTSSYGIRLLVISLLASL
jgi:hypothetical protein